MSVSLRETTIFITDDDVLFPSETLYPSNVLFPGSREITNIVAGSLKLDEIIVEKTPQFGQLYSSKFECQIYLEEDLSGKNIAVYQKDDNNVLHSVFMGKIESCKTDRLGTDRTIVAYDKAYWLNATNVAEWWRDYWDERESATLKQVRDALLEYVGLAYDDVTLPNDTLSVKKDVSLTSCTFQQMLKMICELNCCFPHIDRTGTMTFIVLNPNATPVDLDGRYEWLNSNFEEYTTSTIEGVQFFDSDEQLKYTVGEAENSYPIKKNIFLYDAGTSTLTTVGNTMIAYLETLSYTPANIKMIVADFELHLGTTVEAEGHKFFVFQNYYSGQQFIEQSIKAEGDEQLYNGTATLNYGEFVLNEKIARVHQDVEEFYIEYGEYKEEEAIKESTYHGSYTPTNNNYPANEWTTDALKEAHLNDVFYNTSTRKYYIWKKTEVGTTVTYGWEETEDLGYGQTLSLYRQNASQILMRVRKGTVSSELSLEPDQIVLSSGRLIITSGNFQLDADGILTAKGAILENALIKSESSSATIEQKLDINSATILFNDGDAYIEYTRSNWGSSSRPNWHTYLNIYSSEDLVVQADDDLYLRGKGGTSSGSGVMSTGVHINEYSVNLIDSGSNVAPIYDADVIVNAFDVDGSIYLSDPNTASINGYNVVTCSGMTYIGAFDGSLITSTTSTYYGQLSNTQRVSVFGP